MSLQIVASGLPSGDSWTYSATDLPPGLRINQTTGAISGTVTGAITTYSVTVKRRRWRQRQRDFPVQGHLTTARFVEAINGYDLSVISDLMTASHGLSSLSGRPKCFLEALISRIRPRVSRAVTVFSRVVLDRQ